jgi:hypothetical protein
MRDTGCAAVYEVSAMGDRLLCPHCGHDSLASTPGWEPAMPSSTRVRIEIELRTCRACGFSWPYRDYTNLPDDLDDDGDAGWGLRSLIDRLERWIPRASALAFAGLSVLMLALVIFAKGSEEHLGRLFGPWCVSGVLVSYCYISLRPRRRLSDQEQATINRVKHKIFLLIWGVLGAGVVGLFVLGVSRWLDSGDPTVLMLLLLSFIAIGGALVVLLLARVVVLAARLLARALAGTRLGKALARKRRYLIGLSGLLVPPAATGATLLLAAVKRSQAPLFVLVVLGVALALALLEALRIALGAPWHPAQRDERADLATGFVLGLLAMAGAAGLYVLLG